MSMQKSGPSGLEPRPPASEANALTIGPSAVQSYIKFISAAISVYQHSQKK